MKKYLTIILIGFILRLILSAITYHPDVRNFSFPSGIILREGNLNPYDFKILPYNIEIADDLPLVYWLPIPIYAILSPFVDKGVEYQFFTDATQLFGSTSLYIYLMLIKLPLILFDILLGAVLMFLVNPEKRKKVLMLWMFNPMTLWATSMIGQFDILPTFFIVLAYFLLTKKNTKWSAVSLGMAAALKSFAFLIAPFLILAANGWKERMSIAGFIALPWVLSVLPYIGSLGFRQNALLAPQIDKIFFSKIFLSGGEAIFIVPALLIFLYLLYLKKVYLKKTRSAQDFLIFSTIGLLLTLAFTHFHLQWFLWITPFLLILYTQGFKTIEKICLTLIIFSILSFLFLFDPSLQTRLFAPLFPVLKDISGISDLLRNEQIIFLRSITATVFGSASIFLSYSLIKNEKI